MTDATKAIVWDAVYTPFGQVHSIAGTATNNQRFPGQYADSETGYSYNYFRDYDPTTGRYVQSDPIGLGGGLNGYGYVGGNPFTRIDPRGLAFIDILLPVAPAWMPEWVGSLARRALGPIILILSIPGDTPQEDCEFWDCTLISDTLKEATDKGNIITVRECVYACQSSKGNYKTVKFNVHYLGSCPAQP